jgi:hypothetical protein
MPHPRRQRVERELAEPEERESRLAESAVQIAATGRLNLLRVDAYDRAKASRPPLIRSMRQIFLALLLLVMSASRAHAQHFDLELSRDSVTLGQVVDLRARIHIGPQQTLASPVPVVAEGLPDGARVVGIDTLKHQADRTLLLGGVRMAFFRPGRLRIPPLRVIVKATPDDRGFMLESEPLYVDVVPSLPAGNPTIKDIRDQLPEQKVDPLTVVAAIAALCLLLPAGWLTRVHVNASVLPSTSDEWLPSS